MELKEASIVESSHSRCSRAKPALTTHTQTRRTDASIKWTTCRFRLCSCIMLVRKGPPLTQRYWTPGELHMFGDEAWRMMQTNIQNITRCSKSVEFRRRASFAWSRRRNDTGRSPAKQNGVLWDEVDRYCCVYWGDLSVNRKKSLPCSQTRSWIFWLGWWTTAPRGSVRLVHTYAIETKWTL